MPKSVLRTKQIGLRTHYSGHPLAPMEIVYEVEKPPGFWARLWRLSWQKKTVVACALYLIWGAAAAVGQLAGEIGPATLGLIGMLASLFFGAAALRRFFNPY